MSLSSITYVSGQPCPRCEESKNSPCKQCGRVKMVGTFMNSKSSSDLTETLLSLLDRKEK
jgi:hypothetical protein